MRDPLDERALAAVLDRLPGWTGDRSALERTATLPSFRAAIEAVRRVADLAEDQDHHPDIDIRWRTLTFRCSTHSAGHLVTEQDVLLAEGIERVLGELAAGDA